MNKDVKLWDRFAKGYYKKPISDPDAYKHKLKKTREYLKPDMNAVEFGCGTGGTALLHAPYLQNILATDISQQMIEIAKSRPEFENVDNVTFETTSLEDIQINDESIDVVFALSLLHLLRSPEKAVSKIHQILRPGGIFVSSTACIDDIFPAFKWLGPMGYFFGIIPFLNVFASKDLEAFIRNSGFSIEYQWSRNKADGKDKAVFIIAKKL